MLDNLACEGHVGDIARDDLAERAEKIVVGQPATLVLDVPERFAVTRVACADDDGLSLVRRADRVFDEHAERRHELVALQSRVVARAVRDDIDARAFGDRTHALSNLTQHFACAHLLEGRYRVRVQRQKCLRP